jgi:hypothetical protein
MSDMTTSHCSPIRKPRRRRRDRQNPPRAAQKRAALLEQTGVLARA